MKIVLLEPRGMCAGVRRAIETVERALERFGAPIYVRKEIVHNRQVVGQLAAQGAVFVDELDQVPEGARVIFSAHGVAPAVRAEAERRELGAIDATCPLVTKVHRAVVRAADRGRAIALIGHPGHDEVVGTMGHAPPGEVTLVSSKAQAAEARLPTDRPITVVTQTTLSVDDADEIIDALAARYPDLQRSGGICHATTSRQAAVKQAAAQGAVDLLLVVGSSSSSNTLRLVEVARAAGLASHRIEGPEELDPKWLGQDVETVGISSGASTPESSVKAVMVRLRELGASCSVGMVCAPRADAARQDRVGFALPPELRAEQGPGKPRQPDEEPNQPNNETDAGT